MAGSVVVFGAALAALAHWAWTEAPQLPAERPAAAVAGTGSDSALVADTGASTRAAGARAGCLGAPAGANFVYRLEDRSDFTLHSPEAGTQPGGRLHVEGNLTAMVLDRRGDEVLVREQLDGLVFLGADGRAIEGDPVQQSLVAAAATPLLVRLDARGRVLGLGFAEGLDGDQRNFLRGMHGVLRFQAPAAGDADWDAAESDTTGDYAARYEVLPAADDEVRVRRTRRHYTQVAGHDELPAHALRGHGEATFALEHGWLAMAMLDETMTLALPLLELQLRTERRATARLVASAHVSVDEDLTAAWRRATAPASGAGEQVGRFAADNERQAWQQRLAGVSLDQLLDRLQQLLAQAPADAEAVDAAFQQLQWLARLDDEVVAGIRERLDTRQLPGELAGVALSALGAAGTPSAQAALDAVRSDRSQGFDIRQAATIATLQLEAPSPQLVAGLHRDAGSDFDGREGALLVLGALAPRSGSALADGRSPLAALLDMEADAAARGDLRTWLLAIGNAAPAQTVQIARCHLDHADPAVRAAACVALRRIADPVAVTILIDRGLTDPMPAVRHECVLVLARRSEPAAREALQRIAQQDPDENVRGSASRALQGGS
ncbi:MAG: HEAT repeat domain-containing protein [Planctomycetes bacterium]|nr:HEAT repeat domain-containing protein [Planctomycetota bacterium]